MKTKQEYKKTLYWLSGYVDGILENENVRKSQLEKMTTLLSSKLGIIKPFSPSEIDHIFHHCNDFGRNTRELLTYILGYLNGLRTYIQTSKEQVFVVKEMIDDFEKNQNLSNNQFEKNDADNSNNDYRGSDYHKGNR